MRDERGETALAYQQLVTEWTQTVENRNEENIYLYQDLVKEEKYFRILIHIFF